MEAAASIIIVYVLFIILAIYIFFLPSTIAFNHNHPNKLPILIINILLGGTGVVWVGLLIWVYFFNEDRR